MPIDVQVYLSGAGEGANGSVTSSPTGISSPDHIDCGATCLATFTYADSITLTAHPANTATFGFWVGGPCDGSNNPVCSFIVPELNVETTASFYGLPPASQPPGPTPHPTATAGTPSSPRPSAHPTTKPGKSTSPSIGPSVPAETTSATALPSVAPVGSQAPGATAEASTSATAEASTSATPAEPTSDSGGSGLIPILLLLGVLVIVVGGGGYLLGQRRRVGPPPRG